MAYGQLSGWCQQKKNTVSGPIRLGQEVAKLIFLKDVVKIRLLFRLDEKKNLQFWFYVHLWTCDNFLQIFWLTFGSDESDFRALFDEVFALSNKKNLTRKLLVVWLYLIIKIYPKINLLWNFFTSFSVKYSFWWVTRRWS